MVDLAITTDPIHLEQEKQKRCIVYGVIVEEVCKRINSCDSMPVYTVLPDPR